VYSHFDWPAAVKWLQGLTDLPIAIKGIQCWEDAALCMHYGVHPWLSNHGGRQLDGAPSAADTLVSIRKYCPEVFDKCEVIVDGGITRGSDVVKAVALGARAVGLGRGFLYSLVFGEKGTGKAIRILKHEVETTMALLGVSSLDQLNPSYVSGDTSCVDGSMLISYEIDQVDASSLDYAFTRAHL
jgi:L-lactate dehydrogenase (cytochrome)